MDVGAEGLGVGELALSGEDRLADARGEVAAGLAAAGLHQHRPALRRPRHAERSLDREEVAAIAGGVDARRIVWACPVVPAVPQAGHGIDERGGAFVAQRLLHRLGAAEIQRGLLDERGHDVPAGAAAGQVVQGRELGGDRGWLVVGRG